MSVAHTASTVDTATLPVGWDGHSAMGSRLVAYLWRERLLAALLRPFIATDVQAS